MSFKHNFSLIFLNLFIFLSIYSCGVKGPPISPEKYEITPWQETFTTIPNIVETKNLLDLQIYNTLISRKNFKDLYAKMKDLTKRSTKKVPLCNSAKSLKKQNDKQQLDLEEKYKDYLEEKEKMPKDQISMYKRDKQRFKELENKYQRIVQEYHEENFRNIQKDIEQLCINIKTK